MATGSTRVKVFETTARRAVVLLVLALAVPARAQDAVESPIARGADSQDWSGLASKNLPPSRIGIYGNLNWAGLFGGVLYGVTNRFSVGGSLGIDWGGLYFGSGSNGISSTIGINLQADLRYQLYRGSFVSVGMALSPGVRIGWRNQDTEPTLLLPLSMRVGFAVSNSVTIVTGIDLPVQVYFPTDEGQIVTIPVFGTVGVEYRRGGNFAMSLVVGLGPVFTFDGVNPAEASFGWTIWPGVLFTF